MTTRKAALVTGAARRVGRAIALHLARDGWDVGIHYNSSEEKAEDAVSAARDAGAQARAYQCDLTDIDAVAGLASAFCADFPAASLLVNSAALFEHDRAETFDTDLFDAHMAVNTRAPVLLSKSFHEHAQQNCSIVNMLDQKVGNLTPDYFSYTLSKCALDAATRMLAMEFAPKTRVNAIAPGIVLQSGDLSEDEFERLHRDTILGVGVSLEEICNAIRFFANSPAVTGQVLTLDGGRHLTPSGHFDDLPKLED